MPGEELEELDDELLGILGDELELLLELDELGMLGDELELLLDGLDDELGMLEDDELELELL